MTNPKVATLCDHFDQGSVNSALWGPNTGGLASIESYTVATQLTPSPSYVNISFPSTFTIPVVRCQSTNGLVSNLTYDLTGSGLQVELVSWAGTGTAWFSIGSVLGGVGFELSGSQIAALDSSANGNYFTYAASTFRYLRIRESSGTVYWDYSSDGITWTNAFSEADPFSLTSVNVYLTATSGSPDVRWANLNYVL